MRIEIEVAPTEMLSLLAAVYRYHKAAPHPSADISDLVRACFLRGLSEWEGP